MSPRLLAEYVLEIGFALTIVTLMMGSMLNYLRSRFLAVTGDNDIKYRERLAELQRKYEPKRKPSEED